MAYQTVQPKPQANQTGSLTEQQLINLYGKNPSLVTTGAAQNQAQQTSLYAGQPSPYNKAMQNAPYSNLSYEQQAQTGQVPQGYYGFSDGRYYTEGASAEAETAAANREQAGETGGFYTSGYVPPNPSTPGWDKLSAQQKAAIQSQQSLPGYSVDQYSNLYSLDSSGNKVYTSAGKQDFSADVPIEMSWDDALGEAGQQLNPVYDSLRTKAEMQMSDEKELIPQLMAARFGMGGMRGGRLASSYVDQSQKEAATISDIEGKRQSALAEMARAIKTQDWDQAMQLYQTSSQLAIQQQQLALQARAAETDNWYKKATYQLQMMGFTSDQAQRELENNPLYWRNVMEKEGFDADLAGKRASTQATLNEQDPEFWKNQAWLKSNELDDLYKKAQINKMNAPARSGSGSGSGYTAVDPTAAAVSSIYQYGNPEEAITAYKMYAPAMAAQGVDLTKVRQAMEYNWPNFAFGTNLEERRGLESQGLVYLNGRWVAKEDY